MKLSMLILILGTISCGFNGTQKLETNDSKQSIDVSGSSYSYIVVQLGFLQQIQDLCKQKLLRDNYSSDELYSQAIAQCTFDSLSLLKIDPATTMTFVQKYCQPNSDLSEFTPEQQLNIKTICATLH